jgi:hypothetical protein
VPYLLAYLHSNLLHSQSLTFPFPQHLVLFSKLSMPKFYLPTYLTATKFLTYLRTYMVTYYISIVLCSYSLCVLLVLSELYIVKFMECIQAITTFIIPFKECLLPLCRSMKNGTKNLMNELMKLFTYLKIYIMYNLLRNSFLFLMGLYYRKMQIGCKLQFVLHFYNRIILSSIEHYILFILLNWWTCLFYVFLGIFLMFRPLDTPHRG